MQRFWTVLEIVVTDVQTINAAAWMVLLPVGGWWKSVNLLDANATGWWWGDKGD